MTPLPPLDSVTANLAGIGGVSELIAAGEGEPPMTAGRSMV
jgi:hypothetical protein